MVATYWKNGIFTNLTDSLTKSSNAAVSIATALTFHGADLYIAGYEYIRSFNAISEKQTAVYWKNGIPTVLGSISSDSSINAMAVNGSDIYMAGHSALLGE